MNAQNLFFNILTFEFPSENQTFYFSKENNGRYQYLHKTLFPNEIDTLFSDLNKVIRKQINKVYQFSRIYWKSVRQQNLPVTIKYPEMIAKIAPHFDGDDIPEFGKDNLWFL